MWKKLPWFCVDTETTGLKAGVDRICSLGAVWFQEGRLLKERHALIDPQRPILPQATEVHQITNAMVQGCPTIEQVAAGFFDEMSHAKVIVGYHIQFDDDFLYEAYGSRWSLATENMLFVDVLPLARRALPTLDNHRLASVAEALRIPPTADHSATGDALATCRILQSLIHILPDGPDTVGTWGRDLHIERVARAGQRLIVEQRAAEKERRLEEQARTIAAYHERVEAAKAHHLGDFEPVDWSVAQDLDLRSGVIGGDVVAMERALKALLPTDLGAERSIVHSTSMAEVSVRVRPASEAVPEQTPRALKSGEVRWKDMPKGERWELYQDYVCSLVLRAALETFAIVPGIDDALIHARLFVLNSATGHDEDHVVVSARVSRDHLTTIDLRRIDASDCIASMEHRMDFSKRQGLRRVEPLEVPAG